MASTAAQATAWRSLLVAQGWRVPPLRCWTAHLAGLFLGRLTPNHVGEWAKVAYVLEGPAGRGLATVAGEKLLRAALLVALGPVAALGLTAHGWREAVALALAWPGRGLWGLLAAGGVLLALALLAVNARWFRLPGRERLTALWSDFRRGLADLWSRHALVALGWTGLALAAFCLQALLVGRALAIAVPAPTLLACHGLALAVFTLVPVSAGGFGTEEVVLLALFGRLGVGGAAALSYALLNIALLSLFLPALGALVWLASPLPLSPPSAESAGTPERLGASIKTGAARQPA